MSTTEEIKGMKKFANALYDIFKDRDHIKESDLDALYEKIINGGGEDEE